MNDAASPNPTVIFQNVNSLSAIRDDCWASLSNAVNDRECGWRIPALATATAEGVRQRIVVLRDVDPERQTLLFHTDARSPKVDQIRNHSLVDLLFYDAASMCQLQATAVATIHTTDEFADRLWEHESESSLRGYLAPLAPGTVCEDSNGNLPQEVIGRVPSRAELTEARLNFAVIQCSVQSLEWLLLRRQGNLRARFVRHSNGIQSEWLAP